MLRDALELVQTSVFEHKPRACREVLDSRRDEELARLAKQGLKAYGKKGSHKKRKRKSMLEELFDF